MSVRYEGAYARDTGVHAFLAGNRLGEDVLTTPALLFDYGDFQFYVEGPKDELVEFARRVLDRAEGIAEQAPNTAGGRLAKIIAEHASDLDDALLPDELHDEEGRYLLIEEQNGYGTNIWLSRHDTPEDAAYYVDHQSEGWEIKALIDLETGTEFDYKTKTTFARRP